MGEILSGTGHASRMLGRSDEAQKELAEAMKIAERAQEQGPDGADPEFPGGPALLSRRRRGRAAPLRAGAPDRLENGGPAARAAVPGEPREGRDCRGASPARDRDVEEAGRRVRRARLEIPVGRQRRLPRAGATSPRSDTARPGRSSSARSRGARSSACAPCSRGAITCSRPPCDPRATPPTPPGTSAEARRILEEIRKEAKTDDVVKRADLAPILAEAR